MCSVILPHSILNHLSDAYLPLSLSTYVCKTHKSFQHQHHYLRTLSFSNNVLFLHQTSQYLFTRAHHKIIYIFTNLIFDRKTDDVDGSASLSCCMVNLNMPFLILLYCTVAQSRPSEPVWSQSFQFIIIDTAVFEQLWRVTPVNNDIRWCKLWQTFCNYLVADGYHSTTDLLTDHKLFPQHR